eukprot:UN4734
MLLGPLEELKKGKHSVASAKAAQLKKQKSMVSVGKRFGQIKRDELRSIGLLGCGGFGAVELVEHEPTSATYALKAISKGYVVESGMQQNVLAEKDVQLMCDSPFIIKLYETYNGEQSLYLLLELALGGELFTVYNRKNFWGKEPHARYYVGGTVFAFEHL